MLRVIFTKNSQIRDTVISSLNLSKNPTQVSVDFQVYQKNDWILIFSTSLDVDVVLPTILENWDPDRLYMLYFWRSVDMVHEIGDVILPNVFMNYVDGVATLDTESENPELPQISAKFLDIYNEQKDYYVEDYGLSVWGIVVDRVPEDESLNTALMMTYEWDIYTSESLDPAYTVVTGDLVPAMILCGINQWKKAPHESGTPEQMAVRNMLWTIRLMEEDSEVE